MVLPLLPRRSRRPPPRESFEQFLARVNRTRRKSEARKTAEQAIQRAAATTASDAAFVPGPAPEELGPEPQPGFLSKAMRKIIGPPDMALAQTIGGIGKGLEWIHALGPTSNIVQSGLEFQEMITGETPPGLEALQGMTLLESFTPGAQRAALGKTKLPYGVMTAIDVASDPLGFALPAARAGIGALARVPKAALAEAIPTTRALPSQLTPGPLSLKRLPPARPNVIPGDDHFLRTGTPASFTTQKLRELEIASKGNRLLRPLASFARHIDASPVMTQDELGRHMTAYNRLLVWGDSTNTLVVSKFGALVKKALDIDADGSVLANLRDGTTHRMNVNDFLQNPGGSILYNQPQLELQKQWIDLSRWILKQQQAAGVKIKAQIVPGGQWWPRVVESVKGETVATGITKAIGSKQPTQQFRWYEMAKDGAERGVEYSKNPLAGIELAYKAGIKSIADARFAKNVKSMKGVHTKGIPLKHVQRQRAAAQELRVAKATSSALEKAEEAILVRGVEMPPQLKRLEELLPGRDVRRVLEVMDTQALESLKVEALSRLRLSETKLARAKRAAKRSGEIRSRMKVTESWINQPAFGGVLVPKDIAKRITKFYVDDDLGPILRGVKTVGGAMRSIETTVDFAWSFIQGQPLLYSHPGAWAKATGNGMEAAIKGTAVRERIFSDPDNLAAAFRAADNGIIFEFQGELVEATAASGLLGRIPVIGTGVKLGRTGYSIPGFQQFGESFSVAGDVARLYWWQAMEATAAKRGPQGLQELGDFINKATGTMSMANLGISPRQQAIETMVGFAPRFARATFGLIADAFQGGLRGELARDSLVKMAVGSTVMYYGIAKAMGQEPCLDPRPVRAGGCGSKFMTVKILGQNVGIPGPFISLLRALAHATVSLDKDPKALLSHDTTDNTWLRYLRGKGSPLTGIAWDISTGKTFIGEDVDIMHKPLEATKDVLASRLVPFISEEWLFGDQRPGAGSALEGFGLRSWPVTPWDRVRELRERYGAETMRARGQEWHELDDRTKDKIESKNPDLAQAVLDAKATALDRGSRVTKLAHEQGRDYARSYEKFLVEIDQAAAEYDAVGTHPRIFRQKYDAASAGRSRSAADIRENPRYAELPSFYRDLSEQQRQPWGDIAFDIYMRTVTGNPDHIDEYGNYLFDKRQATDAAFREEWGSRIYDYVRGRLDDTHDEEPELAQDLRKGREDPMMRAFWEAHTLVMERMGRQDLIPVYDVYRKTDASERADMEEANPELKQISRQVTLVHTALQKRNQALDAYLFRFGYRDTMKHADNQGKEKAILGRGMFFVPAS